MFGSQALETVIGLVLMFFIFATAASAITEIYAAVTRKRSKDLTKALVEMFNNGTLPAGADTLTSENVDAFVKTAAGDAKASYLSAKAFADAVTELVSKGDYLGGAGEKLDTLSRQARGRLDTVKAGLETWFDQAMAAVQDRYSKWASLFLLFTGLVLAVAMNASAINVGQDLWNNAAAREAVVTAASSAETTSAQCRTEGTVIEQAQCDVSAISTFQLPIGWGEHQLAGLNNGGNNAAGWWFSHVLGWLLTAVLLMLGAPFWFDVLGKLVNLRAGGPRPKPAPDDGASYSTKVATDPPAAPDNSQWVPSSERVAPKLNNPNGTALTMKSLGEMGLTERTNLYRAASAATYAPPQETESQDVDWLATALNLGVPMQVVRDLAAEAKAK